MKFTGKIKSFQPSEDGMDLVVEVSSNYTSKLSKLIKNILLSFEIKSIKDKRSLQQNKYMFALLRDISMQIDGTPSNYWDYYIDALIRADVKSEFIGALEVSEEALRSEFNIRAIKKIKPIDLNGKDGYMYQIFPGSSQMDKKEMSKLIEVVINMGYECGLTNMEYYNDVLK